MNRPASNAQSGLETDSVAPNPPRASHVIPARLLAQFAIGGLPDRQTRSYRRSQVLAYGRNVRPKPIGIPCLVDNDFYAFTNSDGTENHKHEGRMAEEIEAPFNELLPLFESNLYVPNRADASVIARYVSNLFNRTHQRRQASYAAQRETVVVGEALVADLGSIKQLTAAYSFLLGMPMEIADVAVGTARVLVNKAGGFDAFFLNNLEKHEDSLFEILKGQPYGRLRAPSGSFFVTSDTAVLTRLPQGHGFSLGEGFGKSGVHTLLPISPKTCLQIGIANLDLQILTAEEVAAINSDTVKLMHRWVYSHVQNDEIDCCVQRFGGSVRYKVNAFVTRPLTKEFMLDVLVGHILDEHTARPRRRKGIVAELSRTIGSSFVERDQPFVRLSRA